MSTSGKGILTICFIALLGCTYPDATGENRKLWYDQAERQEFIDSLKASGIPFRIDSEGGVWYPADQVEKVDSLSKAILEKRAFPAFSYEDPRDAALFKKRLEEASIPFEVKNQLGREWVTWDGRYESQVRDIQDKVDQESMARSKRARELDSSRKPSSQ